MLPRAASDPRAARTRSDDNAAAPLNVLSCHSATPSAAIPATEPATPMI